jgi:biopolymer transport protein ExbD
MELRRGFFHRREQKMPGLNTSALPDLIFTVLFFFMIVTHMRDVELQVHYTVPQGTEVQKLAHKASITYIYVGRTATDKDSFCIQLNNRLATIGDIREHIEQERARMSAEDQSRMTVSIKADRDVPMGMIADIKQALQKSFALRINYSATERNTNNKQ